MALSILKHGSRRLPVLNCVASQLLANHLKNPQLVLTSIIANNISEVKREVQETKKYNSIDISEQVNTASPTIFNAEKLLSVGLVGLIPVCVYHGGTLCDNYLAIATTLHMHWSEEAVVIDYIHPSFFGKIAQVIVYVISACTLGWLIHFNVNDVGISRFLKRMCAIESTSHNE